MRKQERKTMQARGRRMARVRAKVKGTEQRPRLSVARSLRHISAQLVDDAAGKTLVSASDTDVKAVKGAKPAEVAREVGKEIAKRAIEKNIQHAVFDRRDKKYHGRVKAVADGAREGGLIF